MKIARQHFKKIPTSTGVYFFHSKNDKILYIGKAKNLRKRLYSYLHKNSKQRGRHIENLVKNFAYVTWEEHPNEQTAIRRERELIRAFVPRYNLLDAWQENYLFVGLARKAPGILKFVLGDRPQELEPDYVLHGCYSQRRQTKLAQAALLRLMYAAHNSKPRFSIPAKLTKAAAIWTYELKVPRLHFWYNLVSNFYHGQNQNLLKHLVVALLKNETIPEYMRLGLQRDVNALKEFAESLKSSYVKREGQKISSRQMRQSLRDSIPKT